MRIVIALCLCLAWLSSQAQTVDSKVSLHRTYIPQFTVKEATGSNVQATGIRWMFSDYDRMPLEFGFHAYAGYDNVAQASFGLNLAWLLAELKSLDFKIGFSLSKIDLEDVEVNKDEFGPHVGDVTFTEIGNEFKPYFELEWSVFRYGSLFVHTGYRIINGERSVVTEIEGSGLDSRVTARDQKFFYSASGIEFGVGLSINFRLSK